VAEIPLHTLLGSVKARVATCNEIGDQRVVTASVREVESSGRCAGSSNTDDEDDSSGGYEPEGNRWSSAYATSPFDR